VSGNISKVILAKFCILFLGQQSFTLSHIID
jgi:hypothetical protein